MYQIPLPADTSPGVVPAYLRAAWTASDSLKRTMSDRLPKDQEITTYTHSKSNRTRVIGTVVEGPYRWQVGPAFSVLIDEGNNQLVISGTGLDVTQQDIDQVREALSGGKS